PLGTGRDKSGNTNFSRKTRFVLKTGDHLDRSDAPAIARRACRVTANFSGGPMDSGVIVAQGGSAHGYSLFISEGFLHFAVRSRGGIATARIAVPSAGSHLATASFDAG